ncbi:serine hydrolase [Streptomyces sp. NPDC052225]|uniref:D-alanyl-D-alanine carboxypeptidase family protein n=1 Tax=Streptomyces sp. NPDC052225 TaxID=3154949 RepID=UPI0034137F5F
MPATHASYFLKKSAVTATAAVLAASGLALTATAPASAADKPPARMSTVGGELLGKPGTQVNLGSGAPVLPKELTAKSWIVSDAESGEVLAAHNAHWRLPPASTLKMLFADTVLPKFPRTQRHKVELSDLQGVGAGSSVAGIKEGYTYTVRDLWLGVFLRSGNDAVHVLSALNGGVPQTVKEMQARAAELGAKDTHVVTPDGYDEKGQYSSAYDLSLFARYGLQRDDFREYCATVTAKLPLKQKKGKTTKTFEIQNTNRLFTGEGDLSPYKGIAGVKNGNTTNAGATFTGVAQRGGKILLVTVMTPQNSKEAHAVYKETARLLDWGFQAAGKVTPVGRLVGPAESDAPAAGASSTTDPKGDAGPGAKQAAHAAVSTSGGSSGIGIALAITGGVLVVLAGAVFAVRKKWPLRTND